MPQAKLKLEAFFIGISKKLFHHIMKHVLNIFIIFNFI
jgi:hypothetical protein